MEILATRIRQARESCKLTQTDLCTQLNVTPMTVYRWENGKAIPRLQQLEELAKITNKPLYWFFAPDKIAVVEPSTLTPAIIELIKVCQSLNIRGQSKILSIAIDYLDLSKYKK